MLYPVPTTQPSVQPDEGSRIIAEQDQNYARAAADDRSRNEAADTISRSDLTVAREARLLRFSTGGINKANEPEPEPEPEPNTCSICYEECGDNPISTCRHQFCSDCILGWVMRGNTTCPCCRQEIIPMGSNVSQTEITTPTATNERIQHIPTSISGIPDDMEQDLARARLTFPNQEILYHEQRLRERREAREADRLAIAQGQERVRRLDQTLRERRERQQARRRAELLGEGDSIIYSTGIPRNAPPEAHRRGWVTNAEARAMGLPRCGSCDELRGEFVPRSYEDALLQREIIKYERTHN